MTREELADKVDWEGGVAEAILYYGLPHTELPADAPYQIVQAWKALSEHQASVDLIQDWLEGK